MKCVALDVDEDLGETANDDTPEDEDPGESIVDDEPVVDLNWASSLARCATNAGVGVPIANN